MNKQLINHHKDVAFHKKTFNTSSSFRGTQLFNFNTKCIKTYEAYVTVKFT